MKRHFKKPTLILKACFIILCMVPLSCFSKNDVELIIIDLPEDSKFKNEQSKGIKDKINSDSISTKEIAKYINTSPLISYYLGLQYFNDGDTQKSLQYLDKASDIGVTAANIALGDIYRNGWGGKKTDLDKATHYFGKSSGIQSEGSTLRLAEALLERDGDSQNVRELLKSLGDKGSAEAYFNLGILSDKYDSNLDSSIQYFEKAAQLGHSVAQYNLFVIYSKETSRVFNPEKGTDFLVASANNGYPEAQYFLADGLIQSGVEELYVKGLKIMESSANNGFVHAQAFLGQHYSHKIDSQSSFDLAEKWYRIAALNGHEQAQHNLTAMYDAFKEAVPNAGERKNSYLTELRASQHNINSN